MSEWPCCFKERGTAEGCSRESVVIDGEEHDLIPYGHGERSKSYDEQLTSFAEEIESGGRGRLTADHVRKEKEQFLQKYPDEDAYNDRQCHDCGVPVGAIHHLGCDMEECPNCGGQYFICDCVTAEKEELWADN